VCAVHEERKGSIAYRLTLLYCPQPASRLGSTDHEPWSLVCADTHVILTGSYPSRRGHQMRIPTQAQVRLTLFAIVARSDDAYLYLGSSASGGGWHERERGRG
jgi:hypothetical protein